MYSDMSCPFVVDARDTSQLEGGVVVADIHTNTRSSKTLRGGGGAGARNSQSIACPIDPLTHIHTARVSTTFDPPYWTRGSAGLLRVFGRRNCQSFGLFWLVIYTRPKANTLVNLV